MKNKLYNKIPGRIKLGYFDIKLNIVEDLDNGETAGSYNNQYKRILLTPIKEDKILRETLMHELLHACLDDVLALEPVIEEAVVRALSPRILELFDRNRDLANLILGRKIK